MPFSHGIEIQFLFVILRQPVFQPQPVMFRKPGIILLFYRNSSAWIPIQEKQLPMQFSS